jgi:hypothetical protein
MTQDDISRRLLLTSEICQQLQLYAQEITREKVSRAYLEAFASRALRRCAELYTLSRPEAFGAPDTASCPPQAAWTDHMTANVIYPPLLPDNIARPDASNPAQAPAAKEESGR